MARPQFFLSLFGFCFVTAPFACNSLSLKKDLSSPKRRRRRGVFPFWRIAGDRSSYEFPCISVPFRREWPDDCPFLPNDFVRINNYNDGTFYALPRLVYHIDEPAVCALTQHYRRSITRNSDLLDICSSWASHYPTEFPETMKSIRATGMNYVELFFNDQLTDGFVVADLNGNNFVNKPGDGPRGDYGAFSEFDNESVDVITCALSIDYLMDPIQILMGCNRLLRVGGKVIVSFSSRFYVTKATRLWRVTGINFHLELVNAFIQYAGNYEQPMAYNITPSIPDKSRKYRDPLFVIEAVKKKS